MILLPAETVGVILLPASTVCVILLLASTVGVILLPAETLERKQNYTDNLGRKPFITHSSLDRKEEIADSLSGSQKRRIVSAGSENWRTSLYPVLYNWREKHKSIVVW